MAGLVVEDAYGRRGEPEARWGWCGEGGRGHGTAVAGVAASGGAGAAVAGA